MEVITTGKAPGNYRPMRNKRNGANDSTVVLEHTAAIGGRAAIQPLLPLQVAPVEAHHSQLAPNASRPIGRLIRLKAVEEICGAKKSFIYAQPDFPKPVRLGNSKRSAVRWVEAEVQAWVERRIQARD